MFILNWDFDVLPITFDENFMLYSLFTYALFFIHVSYIFIVYKIPLLGGLQLHFVLLGYVTVMFYTYKHLNFRNILFPEWKVGYNG